MQLPNTKALMNTESQKTLKPAPESRPPPLEDLQSVQVPHGPKQGKYWETFSRQEKAG